MEERLDAIKALCHAALKQKQCIQKQREKYKEALSELKELKAEYEILQNENENFDNTQDAKIAEIASIFPETPQESIIEMLKETGGDKD